ncbi:MAG: lysine--tRNA ligase [Candidatus Omnitrophica bacterium]|nr:lysine--tRNA ligase [Candidatus Omnitrophota bacterium]
MSDDLIAIRKKKLEALREAGIMPFGSRFEKTDTFLNIRSAFEEGRVVKAAGRLVSLREHGKSVFCDIKDHTEKLQLYLKKDNLGEAFALKDSLDIGDIIGAEGKLFKTRTGEITVEVSSLTVLAKSMRPLPEKWHGLKDVETRYRQRYLDLIANDDVRKIFSIRSRIITQIRRFFDERGYMEVETPMLQPLAGGAAGRPFKTHHNVYDKDLYLRIAPELYLKRLLVGGFERVYEINKSFRNEGISPRHNPEFTMLEVYTAYADYNDLLSLTEELIYNLVKDMTGKAKIEYKGKEIDFTPPWERISFANLMKDLYGITTDDKLETWVEKLKKKGVEIEGTKISRTKLINIIADLIEPKSGAGKPVFVVDYFTELCPLAKTKADDPAISERFELYISGIEIANAYSELNNPIEQKERFEEQLKVDKETSDSIDEDYVRALEYGMPPAAGLGIGIDRLAMIITGQESIRDVILFPQLKPE